MFDSETLSLAEEWRDTILFYPDRVRAIIKKTALENKKELATFFYEQMMQDEAARLFLSNETVHNRLMPSMQKWIVQLFSVTVKEDFVALIELQKNVGQVHARIDLPMHLVLRGARTLKNKFYLLINDAPEIEEDYKKETFKLISDSLDIAMEVMGRAYASSYNRKSRAEESYRLFSAVQNAAAENGRQQSALLDWENQLMFALTVGDPVDELLSIRKSNFGLWFIHKGLHAFDKLPETQVIMSSIERIDEMVINITDQEKRINLLKNIRVETRNIQLNIEAIFNKYNDLESGRDELTRLLSRKYLSVVLSKEVGYARKHGITFGLLAIDLDHFKSVNDAHGHGAGDLVLQQFAEILINQIRAGDYVFRLGGEEFLILLVDVNQEVAIRVAHQLKSTIQNEQFTISNGESLNITASFGVTLFDGHPDYSRSLRRVDQALYQAKEGRNQVVYLEH